MDIILNKIAIWKPLKVAGFHTRPSYRGETYREDNSPVYLTATSGLIRYVKDYEVEGVEFSLFVRTLPNIESSFVESQLDLVAQKITKDYALKSLANTTIDNFEYTPYSVEVNNGA